MSTYKKIQKVMVALFVGILCSTPFLGFAQVEKGVTVAGESTQATTAKAYVNEFGKLVCWPRVNANGKLLTYGPIADTEGADEITVTTAKLHGNILHDGWCSPITEQGFEVSTTADFSSIVTTVKASPVPTFTPCANYPTCTCTDNQYELQVTGLTPGTKYYYRAYAKNSCGTGYGDTLDFTTENDFVVTVAGPTAYEFCASGTNTENATYTASMTPVIAGATYKWFVDGTEVSGETSSTFTKPYTKAETDHEVKCEITVSGLTKDGSITTTVTVLGPYEARDTLKICDCLLPYTFTLKGWTETWTNGGVNDYLTNPTRSHTFTTTKGCDSVVYITLETWTALSETPTSCKVHTLKANETGTPYSSEYYTLTKLKDYDDNEYDVVEIGGMCWMKQNLRTKHFADGTALVPATAITLDANIYYTTSHHIYSKGVCDGNLTMDQHTERYGLMYNWYTAMHNANPDFGMTHVQGICPTGWHLPDTTEWQMLEAAVGSTAIHSQIDHIFAGNSAINLVTGCEWKASTTAGSPGDYHAMGRNSSNFSVRPAGCFLDTPHSVDGTSYEANTFAYSGIWAFFWSSTRFQKRKADGTLDPAFAAAKAAYNYDITFDKTGIARDVNGADAGIGRSVRCVRNPEVW